VYLDTSGESLSRRGYRFIPGGAPMQETLAAGVIRASSWNRKAHFVNPMCGSGTLAIEAALMAIRRGPGTIRSNFCFMHLIPFDTSVFEAIREKLRSRETQPLPTQIVATDNNPEILSFAKKNAEAAGVDSLIEFDTCEFDETPVPEGSGVVVMNPEYGFRLGDAATLPIVYKRIGDFLKQRCAGYTGYVFSGNFDLIKKIGLKARRKIPFVNGSIECRLYEYELYAGTRNRD
jgi:putative N6-adenine-specific DNA methylase